MNPVDPDLYPDPQHCFKPGNQFTGVGKSLISLPELGSCQICTRLRLAGGSGCWGPAWALQQSAGELLQPAGTLYQPAGSLYHPAGTLFHPAGTLYSIFLQ